MKSSTKSSDLEVRGFLRMMTSERGASKNTIESYERDLIHFTNTCDAASLTFKKITEKDLKEYISELSKDYSKSTVSRKISALKQFFHYLLSEKKISNNPTRNISIPKQDKKLPKFLTPAEIDKILDNIKDKKDLDSLRTSLIVNVLAGSGLRVSELISLKLNSIQRADVEGEHRYFFLIMGKGGKERIAPINSNTQQILADYIKLLPSESNWLFPSIKSDKNPLSRQQIANILKKHAALSNIDAEKISPHILRHSFATNILSRGMDLRSVQEILGHSNITTTEIYTHLNVHQLKNFVEEHHPANKLGERD